VRFADGSASQTLNKLTSWTDIPGKQNYSGEAVYSRQVSINNAARAGEHIFIDFGEGTAIIDDRRPNASGMHALLDPPVREAAIVLSMGSGPGRSGIRRNRIDHYKAGSQGRESN